MPRELDALGPNASDLPLHERRESNDQSERNGQPQLNFSLSLESDLPEDDEQDETVNASEGVGATEEIGAADAARHLQRVRITDVMPSVLEAVDFRAASASTKT